MAEASAGLPSGLLGAIASIESGRRDPASGEVHPWPWTADIEGEGTFYPTEAAAIDAVNRARQSGARSIDVGCMQVNLQQHPDAFGSLEEAFDPTANAAYAARFLRELHEQSGDWAKAAALYHSATPALGAEYRRKVLAAWSAEPRPAVTFPPASHTWTASLAGSPFGGAGFVPIRPSGARLAPVAASAAPSGRTLAAYRSMPIALGPRAVLGLRR